MKLEAFIRKIKVILLVILSAFALLFLVKSFIIDRFEIEGSSMEPTLVKGDKVWLEKFSYGLALPFYNHLLIQWKEPEINDIVIYPLNGHFVIKRCVALAGCPLEYSVKEGYTLIVGEKVYPLSEIQYHHMFLSKEVPEGTILCIGDNCETSIDSRNYGFVPVKDVIGKIICK